MAGEKINCLGELKEEVVKKTYELSLKAHKLSNKKYYIEENVGSSDKSVVIFGFSGSWSDKDWFSKKSFGETTIDLNMFRSLRSIGTEETALVNEAFIGKFKAILDTTELVKKVDKAFHDQRQIIFTGHSSGGPLAMLTTLWFLEKYRNPDKITNPPSKLTSPRCITFGSPLLGNRIFPHAIRRENWSHLFVHFVMRYDIVPLIMLAPLSSIEQDLPKILDFFNPKSKSDEKDIVSSSFYTNVLTKASSVVNHVGCKLMGCTNMLVDNFASFVELSPYRPFGTYIFCTDKNKMVVVENPDAVFQMLFHFSRLNFDEDDSKVSCDKLKNTWAYKNMLQSLNMQNAVYLDNASDNDMEELGLNTEAKLCLGAAEESEKQKLLNESNIDKENLTETHIKFMHQYRNTCELKKVGSYDAFKIQASEEDFKVNVARLQLAGIWDDIVDMLKNYELPDTFEGDEKWIKMGTEFRLLFEPVDIANYYRHGRDGDAGTYMDRGRPRRYKFTQKWYEHEKRMNEAETISESCFMAEVEDLIILRKKMQKMSNYDEETMERIAVLERKVLQWHDDEDKVLGSDVFLKNSTFTKWWNSQSSECKMQSCIRHLFADNNVEAAI